MQTGASASSNNNGAAEGGGYVPKYSNGPVKNNLNKKRPNPSQRALQKPEMAKGLEKELSDLPEPSEKNLKKAAEMLEEMLSKGGPEMEKELENLRTSAAELREEMRREDAGGPQLPQGKAGSGPQLPPKSGPQIPPEFAFGPQLPPELGGPDPKGQFTGNPDWAKLMQEEALIDPEVAEMIEGCDGDAKKIYAKVKARFETRSEEIMRESQGRSEGMKVEFREFDPVNLWIWLELYEYPMENERKLLEEVIDAWYTLGHLGGYNTLNFQVSEQGEGVSYMKYDVKEGVDNSQYALFHNMEEVEYKANWARFWVDMGTSDEISLDILINSLLQMSREYVGIKSCVIGGINEDWKEDTERKHADGDLLMRLGHPGLGGKRQQSMEDDFFTDMPPM